jgi:hypothetical protein
MTVQCHNWATFNVYVLRNRTYWPFFVQATDYSTVSPTAAQYWLSRWERAVWAWRNDNWQLEYRTCRLELPGVTNCCTKVLAHKNNKLQVTYSNKWHYNMTVFCPENGGSRYISNRLHGVTSQHVTTLKLTIMSKGYLACESTALYICILLVPRGFENRKQSVKHCAIYADIKPSKAQWLLYVPPVQHSTIPYSAQCICVDLRTSSDYVPIQH